SLPLVPLQYVVSYPIQLFDKIHDTFSTYDNLVKENMALKAEYLHLNAKVQRLLAIEMENIQLKGLKKSSSEINGKVLVSQLLAVSPDPFLKQLTLDKGAKDNVYVGQPVLDAHGVMGQIVEVNYFTSKVLLINDSHSGIPVKIARNGVRAIAVGDSYSGQLKLLNVPLTADVRSGDTLITSGLGEYYPEGYLVGLVTAVSKDSSLQFSTITSKPFALLDKSRIVLLVWPPKSFEEID
ncbi:rod shape-determining protein MreC, partial [Gammaproteobacteria bacterium]|nr:rod shape-determining protein MreC [Gammaproteobacteria bacterium]